MWQVLGAMYGSALCGGIVGGRAWEELRWCEGGGDGGFVREIGFWGLRGRGRFVLSTIITV